MSSNYNFGSTLIFVENLSVAYDDRIIVKNINFEEKDVIRKDRIQGQTIAFVGRSGRGKSTLFKAITGLVKPYTGKVLIPDTSKPNDGKNIPAKEVQEGDVGFVDQKYTLFRHKTVYEALFYSLRKTKLTKAEKHSKIIETLKIWGLEKFKNQYPNELSGGQRQRTAIIEQIFSSGYFIVMDEPFSGLDVGNILSVKETFKIINQENELNTIIFSTHDINLAVELADSIYVIGHEKDENGKFSDYGTIVKHFDLKALGIAWTDFGEKHIDLVKDIKEVMLNS